MQKFRATKLAHHTIPPSGPRRSSKGTALLPMWRDREQRRVVSSDCARVLVLHIAVKGRSCRSASGPEGPTGGPKACTEIKMLSKTACWADETTPLCCAVEKGFPENMAFSDMTHSSTIEKPGLCFWRRRRDFTTNCTLVQMNTTIKWR